MPSLSPLASPSATRAVLEAHGLAAKKALGQNFLVNDGVLQKIVALADVGPQDVVLEVGPGIGTLTIALLKHAARVVSVERDADLPAVLADTCAPWADRFALVEKDALALAEDDVRAALAGVATSPAERADKAGELVCRFGAPSGKPDVIVGGSIGEAGASVNASGLVGMPNKFVANLPYAVAATLVLDYFQRFAWLESATVMVQKEVADRMAASPGTKNYGAYTVKLRLYAEPAGRFAVGPGNFFPPPRVESAVLRLNRRPVFDDQGVPLDADAIAAACTMAEAAFATRRKTLSNSCKTYFAGRGPQGAAVIARLPQLFERAGIDPRLRGETLDLPEFVRLGCAFQQIA